MNNAWKAGLAALLAALTSILVDLRGADATLTGQDWLVTVLAAVVAGIGTYLIPPGAGLRTPPAPRRGQHGHGGVQLIAAIAGGILLAALVLWAFDAVVL